MTELNWLNPKRRPRLWGDSGTTCEALGTLGLGGHAGSWAAGRVLRRGGGLGWACCPWTPPALCLRSCPHPQPRVPSSGAREASWRAAMPMPPRGRPWQVQRGGVGHPQAPLHPPPQGQGAPQTNPPGPTGAPREWGPVGAETCNHGGWPDSETSARLWGWRPGLGAVCVLVFRVPVSSPPCLFRTLVSEPGPSAKPG